MPVRSVSSCHAVPGQPDRTRLGGGLAMPSPFGTFHVPNISPDPVDGIGRWTETDFVNAVTKGTSPAGTHYFPAFPYASYQHARIEDVRDLFAYLKTLAPVPGKVRDHEMPFHFNVRRNVGISNGCSCGRHAVLPDQARSAWWIAAPTPSKTSTVAPSAPDPRTFLGGIVAAQRFAGGPDPEGAGWVPNITQKGLGDWSEKDIAYFLETGETPDGDSAGGSMARVIKNTSQLSPEDRAAIAKYLKSLPPVDGPPRDREGGEKRQWSTGAPPLSTLRDSLSRHGFPTSPTTWFVRLFASTGLPSGVTSMLRTISPPPGIAQVWNCSVPGSKRTMVFGLAADSLYQSARR